MQFWRRTGLTNGSSWRLYDTNTLHRFFRATTLNYRFPCLFAGQGTATVFHCGRTETGARSSNAIDLRDVWVIQRGQHLGFALEAGHAFRVLCEGFRQDLQRNFALEFVSLARYTSPKPPAPIGARISYGPRRVPTAKPIY
jgi:hypothetical protein